MTNDQNTITKSPVFGLQSESICCNLQTTRKLETNNNKASSQIADCGAQFTDTLCNLNINPDNSRDVKTNPVCTQTPSFYERGESPTGDALHLGEKESINRTLPVVLCLDLGTTTGWAIHSKQGVVTSGTISFKNDRWQGGGMRFLKFNRFLDGLNENARPIGMVFFEEVRHHMGVDAAHAYGGFMAHLTAWCEQHDIAYEGVPVGTIKRHATGKGNANKTMMIEAARNRDHPPSDDNEADALVLVYWDVEQRLGEQS